MKYFVIDGESKPTFSKDILQIELNDIKLDTILYLIVASQVAYIQYYGFFPVKICQRLVKQTMKAYDIPSQYHKEMEEDVFRILKTVHDVKQCERKIEKNNQPLFEEMKRIQFKI